MEEAVPEEHVTDQQGVHGQSLGGLLYMSKATHTHTVIYCSLLLKTSWGSNKGSLVRVGWFQFLSPVEGSVRLMLQHLVELFQRSDLGCSLKTNTQLVN